MAYVDQGDPDLLVFRSGGGLLALFGLPFLLAGLFVIALTLGIVRVEGEVPPLAFGLPFGGIFAAVGAAIAFGRAGATIDRRRQSLVKWWGILGLAKRSEYFLPDFCEVALRKDIRKGNNSTYTVYPVCLTSEARQQSVTLEEPRDYASARAVAERVAALVEKPLADSSSGETVVRQPDSLDLSLREAARRSGEPIEVPQSPPQMRSNVSVDGAHVSIELPAAGIQAGHKMMIGALFAFLAFEWLVPFPIGRRGGSFGAADLPLFLAFAGAVFVVPAIAIGRLVIATAYKRVSIRASSAGLRVEERAPFRSSVTEIPAHELEELRFCDVEAQLGEARGSRAAVPTRGAESAASRVAMPAALRSVLQLFGRGNRITALSDRESVSFGIGLSRAEAEYLVALIKKALVS
jgi:hypothetical protein